MHSFILKESRPVFIQFGNKRQALQISEVKFTVPVSINFKYS
ncbi:hypothetical protein KPK_A0095 (plasmid) [Klebsiella variicola]|uniref:Uncharacterized protein n=1 Tax=Klebsiella variicola (strain 342) TaxID=507522 RepID=B5RK19_KLEV3|nr:hypothetical protein KPK_A0095 [Klebsiella variicola]